MTKAEADVWNFLIYWCHSNNAAHLDEIWSWVTTHSEREVTLALESLINRGLLSVSRFGFMPLVEGKPYTNASKDRKWKATPRSLMMASGKIH